MSFCHIRYTFLPALKFHLSPKKKDLSGISLTHIDLNTFAGFFMMARKLHMIDPLPILFC